MQWWWKTRYIDTSFVYILDPSDGSILETIVNSGGTNGAWQQWSMDIQAYRGQTIQLRFLSYHPTNYINVDDILITPYGTDTFTITETNPLGYGSSTPDVVETTIYGGQIATIDFGDFSVDVGQSSLEVIPLSLVADGVETALVTVTMRDSLGNPMPDRQAQVQTDGVNVVIEQGTITTDANGQVTATIHSTVAQDILVSARELIDDVVLPDTENVTFVAGPLEDVQSSVEAAPPSVTADDLSTATITVTLRDINGNPIAGHQVEILPDGTGVTLEVAANISDADGQVTGTIRSAIEQVVTVQGRDLTANVLLTDTATVEFLSTDPDLSTISIDPISLVADGIETTTITVSLKDPFGVPLPGKEVTVQISAGSDNLINGLPVGSEAVSIGITDANGVATATLASTRAEIKTLVATGDGIPLTGSAQVSFVAGPVSPTVSTLTALPTTVTANDLATALVIVTLKDAQGNPVAGHEIDIQVSGVAATLTLPGTPVTDENGQLIGTIRSTAVGQAVLTADDITAGVVLAQQATVTFVAGPTDADHSTIVVEPGTATADGSDSVTVTVTSRDALDNPVAGHVVDLAVSGTDNLVSGPAPAETGADGVAVFTLATTKAETKTLTASDTTQGITLSNQPQVVFTPGAINAVVSDVSASPPEAPADGLTEVTVTVTVVDAFGNPIPGVAVVLAATGSALVTQPLAATDVSGQTIGAITDAVVEAVTVTATADGNILTDNALVQFRGSDLVVAHSAPGEVAAGDVLVYTLSVHNQAFLSAQDVLLTQELPPGVSLVAHTAAVEPTQNGAAYTWNLGTLHADDQVNFTVTALVPQTAVVGATLTSTLTASTSSHDENPANDSAIAETTVFQAYEFSASITPGTRTLNLGGSTTYTIRIHNTGLYADTYNLTANGLDAGWVSFSAAQVVIPAGGFEDVILTVTVSDCLAEPTQPFSVDVVSSGNGGTTSLAADLDLVQAPQIWIAAPNNGSTSGSRSVLFNWRTSPSSSGVLTIYPQGAPEEAQTFASQELGQHNVRVDDLTRYVTYEWMVEATSTCGVATSATQTVTIGSGIVFSNPSMSVSIDRDYDQRLDVTVLNEDSQSHTLTASVINPHEDLIVNFVGSGSIDETITLGPGESRQLTLAIHAQDAAQIDYQLTAHLTADEGTGTPLEDHAVLDVRVLWEGDFLVQEGDLDPLTLGRTYVITNHGKPITDLSIAALDPVTGEPASIFIQPSFSHARLDTDQSITVTVYPIFTAEDAAQSAAIGSGLLASPVSSIEDIPYDLRVTGAGVTQTSTSAATCGAGKQIYAVSFDRCVMEFETRDWYCTNRPAIDTPINVPAFLNEEAIDGATLKINFSQGQFEVLPHSGQINFNGVEVGAFSSTVPSGGYSFPVQPSLWNSALGGNVTQNVYMTTQHSNGGHYTRSTNYVLATNVDQATTYMCAESQALATQAAYQAYPCEAYSAFNWLTDIFPGAVRFGNAIKYSQGGDGELCPDEGISSSENQAQGFGGDPINTQTGAFSFGTVDLSVPTRSCNLTFQPGYSSGTIDEGQDGLGYGWTHNHALRLIFPEDPQGMEGFALYQGISGNRFLFKIEDDGSYTPGPGITATLTKHDGPPVTYVIESATQKVLTFNESGAILSRIDAQGNGLTYTYDLDGRLTRVSADAGSRYLDFAYDANNQISAVSDHTGRTVSYSYDLNGDLASSTDVLGGVWTYAYDAEHRMTQVVDPRGVDSVQTEYDLQGRAYRQYDPLGNLLVRIVYNIDGSASVYDALGRAESHDYDDRSTLTGQVDPLGAATGKTYDANFRPATITDASGDTTSLTWSADGANLEQVVDAAGNQTDLGYDALNNLTSVTDAAGYLSTYTYSGILLTGSTDALLGTTSYTYTPEGFLQSVTDPLGNTTSYTYDSFGQMTSMTDALGNTTSYGFDDLGRLVSTTDALGRVTLNEYDPAGRLLKVTRNYDPARPQNDPSTGSGQAGYYNIVTQYQYDQVGNQIAVTDTYGNTTSYGYDDAGRLVTTTDPQNNQTTNTYNALGQLVATTDALGRTTSYGYDAAGRLVSTTDALGHLTSTAYNPDGTVARTTDALGRSTRYAYDELKRVVATTDALGNSTSTTYDSLGNVAATTDALGRITRYTYDALGRLIRTTGPSTGSGQAPGVTENFYDANGNRVQTIDPNGNATTYAYDELGRLTSVTDAQGHSTSFSYNAVGQRTAVSDAAGNTTTYTYDALGRLVATTNAEGETSTTSYDALGRVTATTDPLGRTTSSQYDALGRLTSSTNPANGTTRYVYDAVGNQTSLTNPNGGTITTVYDNLNRPVTVTDPNGNTTSTTYNAVGNVTAASDALGNSVSFAYDALGRQTEISDPLGNTTSYGYDAAGNRISMTAADGVATRYEYDGLNRLTAVVENYRPGFNADHETNVRTEYAYDPVGNRLSIRDGNGHTTSFGYDSLNRLTSESDPLGNTWSYGYDAVGNRISMTDANGASTGYIYDSVYRLSTIDYPVGEPDVSFLYDDAGQRLSMSDGLGTTTWNYDALGRPTSITDPFGDTVGYSYDAVGNRTGLTLRQAQDDAYPDGKSVSYGYDAGNRLTQVTDWAQGVTSYNYDAANRLTATNLPNGVASTYNYDAAGHLTTITHETAAELLSSFQYSYDAVGNRTQVVETMLQPAAEGPQTYFSDDMEAGGEAWNASGDWALVESATAPSGSHVWSLNPDDGYQRNTDYVLEMASAVSIPADAVRPELSFFDPISAASNSTFNVEITSDDGVTWNALTAYTALDNRADWILRRLPLDDYAGQSVRIRFRAVQGSAYTSDVWQIDDVRIGERETATELAFPFSDDLESGSGNWEFSGQWSVVSGQSFSGVYALDLNPGNEYQRNTDFDLQLSGVIPLPEDVLRPELTWYDQINIASNTTLSVEITADDGLTWETAATFTAANNRAVSETGQADWILRRIPLDAYAGQSIRVRFRAVQGSAYTSDVWRVDDLRVGEREAAPALTFPFLDAFDGLVNANWQVDGQWAIVETAPEIGEFTLSLNPGETYQRNTDFSVELVGEIAIPAEAVRPELTYSDQLNVASNTTLSVEVTLDDGLTWDVLTQFNSSYNRSTSDDWLLRRVPLDAYAGQSIRVRLRAVQGSAYTSDVWLIDDLRVGEREAAPALTFPFVDAFDGLVNANWQVDGQWAIVETAPQSGEFSLSLNPGESYQRNTDFSVELVGEITIPAEALRPELTYSDQLNLASNTTLTVEVTIDDGLTWTTAATYTSADNRAQPEGAAEWVLRRVSLDGYQGETIRLRLRAVQGSAYTRDVWRIDDLRVGEREAAPQLTFPFSEDFETGGDPSTGSGQAWEFSGQWSAVSGHSYSGDYALDLNPGESYQRNTDFSVELAGQITIPAEALRPELSYYAHMELASNTTVSVEATRDDGLSWEPLTSYTSAYNRPSTGSGQADWLLRSAPLDAYKGETIRIRFRAVQGSAYTRDIWRIDALRVAERLAPIDLGFPFSDDLESGLGAWQPDGQWAIVTTDAYSGVNALDLNPGNAYQRNTDFAIELSGSVTIPLEAVQPELRYYDHFELASNTTVSVEITTDDGLSWMPLASFTAAENRPDWVLRTISLEGYQGQTVRLRLRAVQGSAYTADHWYLDDFTVDQHAAPPQGNFPFSDDLESGSENWEFGGQWSAVSGQAYSGSYALDLNPDNGYQRNTDFSVELATAVEIPVEAVRPELTYYDHFNAASNTTLSVEVTTDDGLTWNVLTQFNSLYNRPSTGSGQADWVLRRVPLDAYAGQTIRVRFRAVQGSAYTADHWYIDDVRVGEREAPAELGYPFEDQVLDIGYWEPGGQWTVSSGQSYTGSHALDLNPANEYQRNTDFSVELAGQISIPAVATRPELTYYDQLNIASNTTLKIEVTTDDGQTWQTLKTFNSSYNRSDWILRRVSLDGYQGLTLRLRFRAVQGSAYTSDIWRIDDLRVGNHLTPPALGYPFSDDLEMGSGNWQASGQWSVVSGQSHAGYNALDLNPANEYQRNTDFSVELAGQIAIPAAATRPELTYFDHLNIASNTTLKIEITTDDGQTWQTLKSFTSAHNRSDWILRRVSLDGYQDQSIRLRLRAVQGSAYTSDIWRIDDLRVGDRLTQTLAFPFEDQVTSVLDIGYWEPDGQWTIADTGGYNDVFAWSLNPNGEYQRVTDFALVLGGLVALPADTADLKLSYYDQITAASNTTLYIEISINDAQTWGTLATFTATNNSVDWTLREIPLDAYAGQTIRVRFRAVQGSAYTSDVWLIDVIQIAALEPTETPTPTGTATATAAATVTGTPTAMLSATATGTETSTFTPTPNSTDTPTPVETATATQTGPPAATATPTPVVTATSIATAPATQTPTPAATATSTPPPAPTATATAALPTETPTSLPTETATSHPAATATASAEPTATATEVSNSAQGLGVMAKIVPDSIGSHAPTLPSSPAPSAPVTITYTYDPLNRLTAADYDSGEFFHYTYDSVGNRLTQDTLAGTNTYAYDIANRLTSVDGVPYVWDANGNLLSDGVSTYAYDSANRLSSVSGPQSVSTYAYNGLGDRLQQTVDGIPTNYTIDLNTGLTQVLTDGTNVFLYGVGRIGEQQPEGWAYHQGDALGSVRQLVDPSGVVTQAQSYTPYGDTLSSAGEGVSVYQFTGEARDVTGLTYLRARYLDSSAGRFVTRDTWGGDNLRPLSYNKWNYVGGNPINLIDPSGLRLPGCAPGTVPVKDASGRITSCEPIICLWGRNSLSGRCNEPPIPILAGVSDTPTTSVNDTLVKLGILTCLYLAYRIFQDLDFTDIDVDIDFDKKDQRVFYFVERGEHSFRDSRSYRVISRDLQFMYHIYNVQLLDEDFTRRYNLIRNGGIMVPFFRDTYMGTLYEAELAIWYYRKGYLVSVHPRSPLYDYQVQFIDPIKYVEVKWSNEAVDRGEVNDVIRTQVDNLPPGTLLLETTQIADKKHIKKKGGHEILPVFE